MNNTKIFQIIGYVVYPIIIITTVFSLLHKKKRVKKNNSEKTPNKNQSDLPKKKKLFSCIFNK